MKRCVKLLLSAAVVIAVGLLASSCLVIGDTKIRYVWETSYQPYILSIAASFGDVKDWYEEVWEKEYPDVPLEASHTPKWNGSTEIPDNIWSSTTKDTRYKGQYLPITHGKYTAICTVEDEFGIIDIVANYTIAEYMYGGDASSTTYYELGFDVGYLLNDDKIKPDKWWYLDEYDNSHERPSLSKTPATPESKPFLKVIEESNVTYLVFRRPAKK